MFKKIVSKIPNVVLVPIMTILTTVFFVGVAAGFVFLPRETGTIIGVFGFLMVVIAIARLSSMLLKEWAEKNGGK